MFFDENLVIRKFLITDGELEESSVCAIFAHTAEDGKTRDVKGCNVAIAKTDHFMLFFPYGTDAAYDRRFMERSWLHTKSGTKRRYQARRRPSFPGFSRH